ncbi:hypothetical protein U1Q18_029560 [Sarracenia purpurea var. burkii]
MKMKIQNENKNKKNTDRTRSAKEGRQERRRKRRSTEIGGDAEGEQRRSVVCDGDVCDSDEREREDSDVGGVAGGGYLNQICSQIPNRSEVEET